MKAAARPPMRMAISRRGLKIQSEVGKSLVLQLVIMHGTTAFPEFAQYSNSSLEGLEAISVCSSRLMFVADDADCVETLFLEIGWQR
jgi:hypothetical protein